MDQWMDVSSGTGSPGYSRTKGRKTVLCVCVHSFVDRLVRKFATKSSPNIPTHLTTVATLPCETPKFKNCHAQGWSEAN